MVRVIFSDFDETLLDYHSDKNYFDDYQVSVLKKLRDRDIKFVIVTGRSVNFFDKFSNILPYVSYIISSNGSYIYDVKEKNCIYSKYIIGKELLDLNNFIDINKYNIFYNSKGIQYKDSMGIDYNYCEQAIVSFKVNDIDKVLGYIDGLEYTTYSNICKHSDSCTVDINNYKVSKGNGIRYLCDYLDIDISNTICFGDSDNDLSMFKIVGKSIAMDNAIDEIKKSADDFTVSVDDNGVFKYIDKEILGGK